MLVNCRERDHVHFKAPADNQYQGEKEKISPLQIYLILRQSTVCELTYHTPILAVKMNRRRIIVVLEEQIYVYDISNMKLLQIIQTCPNPTAVCALSPSSDNCFVGYPSRSSLSSPLAANQSTSQSAATSGDVEIFDSSSLRLANIVQAHKSPLSHITINSDGNLLATASEKGTVIRVFSIPEGHKLFQFRRGSYPAKIYSMSFNLVSSLLCVSSDSETVHIFKLATGDQKQDAEDVFPEQDREAMEKRARSGSVGQMLRRSSLHIGRNIAGSVGSYLPEMITEMWEPSRNFASLKLPSSGVRSLVALSSSTPQVMVLTSEGYFYQYNIDLENGGECVLVKQNRL
ncbi:autophagy protein [Apophysomyces ossiformis]|uniref:Autophagy protein n=1 Tax=Apophysomyces ossiformis TaxID=679940 RepID=A0A8H7BK80_9FUNG|nr:autophagy protein [Apophysomyces ossiformis]